MVVPVMIQYETTYSNITPYQIVLGNKTMIKFSFIISLNYKFSVSLGDRQYCTHASSSH